MNGAGLIYKAKVDTIGQKIYTFGQNWTKSDRSGVHLGKGSKTHGTEPFRGGGRGYPPLSVNFFPLGFREPTVRGGGGVPPLSVKKNPLKIGPKTVFLGNFRFRKRIVR